MGLREEGGEGKGEGEGERQTEGRKAGGGEGRTSIGSDVPAELQRPAALHPPADAAASPAPSPAPLAGGCKRVAGGGRDGTVAQPRCDEINGASPLKEHLPDQLSCTAVHAPAAGSPSHASAAPDAAGRHCSATSTYQVSSASLGSRGQDQWIYGCWQARQSME